MRSHQVEREVRGSSRSVAPPSDLAPIERYRPEKDWLKQSAAARGSAKDVREVG